MAGTGAGAKWFETLGKAKASGAGAQEPLLGHRTDAVPVPGGAPAVPSSSSQGGVEPAHPHDLDAQSSSIQGATGGNPGSSERVAADFVRRLQPASKHGQGGSSNFFNRLRQHSIRGQVDNSRVKKFIIRLATALHAYGSSAARTEYLVERAAHRLEVDADIAVFPALLLLSFGDGNGDSLQRQTVMLEVTQDLDVDKLGRVDELARNVGQNKHEILVAYWQLRAISNAPPTFGLAHRLLSFVMMAAAAARLFFGGSMHDAAVAGALGLGGGLIELAANTLSPVASQIVEFLAAMAIAFVARAIISLSPDAQSQLICFYPTSLSALVWFLPGLSLTQGVNELVAKTYVAGSAHIVAAIFSAFQLGFGVAFGASLVFWDSNPLDPNCSANVQPPVLWEEGLWFLLYVTASNVLLNARMDQWPGMVAVAFAGYAVSEATITLSSEASSILSAFAISLAGTVCSRWMDQLPLAMKMSGILVLVPGGIGVKGVAALLQKNSSGTLFVFEMLMVALAITLGLLMGKIFFPEGVFGYSFRTARLDKSKMAELLRKEHFIDQLNGIDEEEGMAF